MKLVSIIFYSEPHPIFYKYSERREQRQIENIVFKFGYAKAHPIFYKYTNFRSKANIERETEQKTDESHMPSSVRIIICIPLAATHIFHNV